MMGRGNVCVTGSCEGLYYIDNDDFHVYRRADDLSEWPETRLMGELDYDELTGSEWVYDEEGTGNEEDDVLECFMADFCQMFPGFERAGTNEWLRNGPYGDLSRRVILESKLFYVCVEDNEWSLAVELLQKEEPWGLPWMENLQKQLYQKYLDGMKKALLNRLPGVGIRTGAWTSGRIKKEECLV